MTTSQISKRCATLFLLVLGATTLAIAGDKKISEKELPAIVRASFQKHFPSATITQVATDNEFNQSVYDVESKDGAIVRDLIFALDGTLLETGEHIQVSALPAALAAAVNAAYPAAKIDEAERKTQGSTLTYEVTVISGKTEHELVLSPSGAILSTDSEDDEDEEGDDD
jgi:hypothetical protein